MTQQAFKDWQDFAANITTRAQRLSNLIRQRAIDISAAKLGPNDGMCFLCAHNWLGQSWMTPTQTQAAREVLYLQGRMFEPGRLAERIIARRWKALEGGAL